MVLLVSACNLERDQIPEEEFRVLPNFPTVTVDPANCVERVDWPEYTVLPGDTLSRIALITESTVEELVAANCLTNAHTIQRGQILRVPRLPQE
jgi:hypothetical protein